MYLSPSMRSKIMCVLLYCHLSQRLAQQHYCPYLSNWNDPRIPRNILAMNYFPCLNNHHLDSITRVLCARPTMLQYSPLPLSCVPHGYLSYHFSCGGVPPSRTYRTLLAATAISCSTAIVVRSCIVAYQEGLIHG